MIDETVDIGKAQGDGNLSEGDGSTNNPYKIQSIEDLVTFSNKARSGETYDGKTIKLMMNLDFKRTESYLDAKRTDFGDLNENGTAEELMTELTTGRGFLPIGTGSNPFKGTFDGNNKTIVNLFEDASHNSYGLSDQLYMGFFGVTEGIDVKDFTLKDVNLTLYQTSGGLIARYAGESKIQNFKISGSISGEKKIGGLVGGEDVANAKIEILDSYNLANISATDGYVGGFIGNIASSGCTTTITNCQNSGKLVGNSYIGRNYGILFWLSNINKLC